MKHIPLILLVLLAVLACKYLSPAQKLESEAATENPNRTIADSPIFLNNEEVKMISSLNRKKDLVNLAESNLKERLASITKEREVNGVLIEGTNEVPNNVYLIGNPELTVGALAELYIAIDENAGSVYIPKKVVPAPDNQPRHPNPTFLAVTTEILDFQTTLPAEFPVYDPARRYAYDTNFEFVKTSESLLSHRAWSSSIEISADERYFVNDKQGEEADKGPKYTHVKQRPIDIAALQSELPKIIEPINEEILIIASEGASYASLLKVFESAERLHVGIKVLVRPHTFQRQEQ